MLFHDIPGEGIGAYEFSEFLAVRLEYGVPVSLPEHSALMEEAYVVSDFQDGVHVMGIDDGSHSELGCQPVY